MVEIAALVLAQLGGHARRRWACSSPVVLAVGIEAMLAAVRAGLYAVAVLAAPELGMRIAPGTGNRGNREPVAPQGPARRPIRAPGRWT